MTSEPINTTENKLELFLADGYSDELLQAILKLEKACFPEDWQYPKWYLKNFLEKPNNINVLLKNGKQIIGYCLAVLMEEEFDEIKKFDQELIMKERFYYIETIEILPEYRGKGLAKRLLIEVCREAQKREVNNFAIHARKINGLNEKIKKVFCGKINLIREIEHWEPADGEPYEYIEWSN